MAGRWTDATKTTARRALIGLAVTVTGLLFGAASAAAQPRLVTYRLGTHRGYDRVVWQFARGLPGMKARYVRQVTADGSGLPVRLEGRAFLQVTLTGVKWDGSAVPPEPTLTPQFPALRQLKPAGVFEGYFTFGLGLSHRVRHRLYTLRRPDRVVLDLTH
jgi:hypothetical protein